MAAAFGRDSPEFLRVTGAMRALIIGGRDDYPERLKDQLARISEYAEILRQTESDDPQPQSLERSSVDTAIRLLSRFPRAARHLKHRRSNRAPLILEDEYDVQYLLQALLVVQFNDVRAEEFGPSVAGGNSRIDFVLNNDEIAIEIKYARDSLTDKKLGEELLVDIGRYQSNRKFKTLICFVYDPLEHLRNPDGLERDLSRLHDGLDVRVIVAPKA